MKRETRKTRRVISKKCRTAIFQTKFNSGFQQILQTVTALKFTAARYLVNEKNVLKRENVLHRYTLLLNKTRHTFSCFWSQQQLSLSSWLVKLNESVWLVREILNRVWSVNKTNLYGLLLPEYSPWFFLSNSDQISWRCWRLLWQQ